MLLVRTRNWCLEISTESAPADISTNLNISLFLGGLGERERETGKLYLACSVSFA